MGEGEKRRKEGGKREERGEEGREEKEKKKRKEGGGGRGREEVEGGGKRGQGEDGSEEEGLATYQTLMKFNLFQLTLSIQCLCPSLSVPRGSHCMAAAGSCFFNSSLKPAFESNCSSQVSCSVFVCVCVCGVCVCGVCDKGSSSVVSRPCYLVLWFVKIHRGGEVWEHFLTNDVRWM